LVEKTTLGQAPFCSSASISVPGAPASSGVTCMKPAVEKPGVEMALPAWVAIALLCTAQPPRPTVATPTPPTPGLLEADDSRGDAPESPAVATMASRQSTALPRTRTLDVDISHPRSQLHRRGMWGHSDHILTGAPVS